MEINKAVEEYCFLHSSSEEEVLQQISRKTHLKMIYPRMLSGHLQGRLLSLLSKLIQAKRILEIGTFTGYGTLCLAEGLTEDGKIHTIEINAENEAFLLENFQNSIYKEKVILHIGDALKIIPKIDETFDLVFIDADKSQYPEYYQLIIDKVRTGGLIIADNVLWGGKVLLESSTKDKETTAIKSFNKMVKEDKRVEKLMLPLRDGLTLIEKK